jgi:hypothetical protein
MRCFATGGALPKPSRDPAITGRSMSDEPLALCMRPAPSAVEGGKPLSYHADAVESPENRRVLQENQMLTRSRVALGEMLDVLFDVSIGGTLFHDPRGGLIWRADNSASSRMAAIDPRSGESVDATAGYETRYRQRKPAPFPAVAGSFLRNLLILTRFGANALFCRESGHFRLGWRP